MSSRLPRSEVETFTDVGTCSCGATEFHVSAMIKSFAGVSLNSKSGHLNVDDSDFKPNLEESEVALESADDLLASGRVRELPESIRARIYSDVDFRPANYVVIRCSGCGTPFDYGDKQIVLGFED